MKLSKLILETIQNINEGSPTGPKIKQGLGIGDTVEYYHPYNQKYRLDTDGSLFHDSYYGGDRKNFRGVIVGEHDNHFTIKPIKHFNYRDEKWQSGTYYAPDGHSENGHMMYHVLHKEHLKKI